MMEKKQPIRVVAAKDGYQADAFELALAYVGAVLKARPDSNPDIVLLTHTKHQLLHTSLAGMLGAAAAKALGSGKSVGTPVGRFRHATLRTIGRSVRDGIIIPFYADEKMLDEVDSMLGILAIVAVPHQEGDAASWAVRWNATVHGQDKKAPSRLITDPVIERAMKTVTLLSNISYGALQTRDAKHADEVFRILRHKGHDLVPEQIKSWAIREQWHPGAATEVAKIAAKVKTLKSKPSISSYYNVDERYSRWKNGD